MTTIKNPEAETHPPLNPRFAGAIFFSLYALLLILFIKYTFLTLVGSTLLPLLPSILFALIAGAFFGACFGNMLARSRSWLNSFFIGLLLAFLVLVIVSLAILLNNYFRDPAFFIHIKGIKDYLVLYIAILASIAATLGIWFIPMTGLMAVYFHKKFLPGLIAADKQRLKTDHSTKPKKPHDS
ncbi:MAG: hypothetical protein H0U73_06690 [Tatlockia sp.]|nr:hypothetical protein [Tatlockia sp.]